jgi:hypothetical protein
MCVHLCKGERGKGRRENRKKSRRLTNWKIESKETQGSWVGSELELR